MLGESIIFIWVKRGLESNLLEAIPSYEVNVFRLPRSLSDELQKAFGEDRQLKNNEFTSCGGRIFVIVLF